MKNLFLTLVIAVGLVSAQPELLIGTDLVGSTPHYYERVFRFDLPSYDPPVPSYYNTDFGDTTPITSGLACGAWNCDDPFHYLMLTNVTASNSVHICKMNGSTKVEETVHWTLGEAISGLAIRYTSSGELYPDGVYGHSLYIGTTNTVNAVVLAYHYEGDSGRKDIVFPGGLNTYSVRGLAFDVNYTALYCLVGRDTGKYQVYTITDLEASTPTITAWSGEFSIPSGATAVFDCGLYGNRIIFGVEKGTCAYPIWSIGRNDTSAIAVDRVGWDDIGWTTSINRNPRGVDVLYDPPYAPIDQTIGRYPSVRNLSVSENPFSSMTTITAEMTGTISIYDLAGRRVTESSFDGEYTWSPECPSGTYLVRIDGSGEPQETLLLKL
jgi:hypothetical protein